GEGGLDALTAVCRGIGMTERWPHPHLSVAKFDWAYRHIVRPQIECAAAFKIEAGVVPMTRQDAVLDGAALERETHVRATIVEGKDAASIVDNKDRTMLTAQNESAFRFQFFKGSSKRKFLLRWVHDVPPLLSHFGRDSRFRSAVNIGTLSRKRERVHLCTPPISPSGSYRLVRIEPAAKSVRGGATVESSGDAVITRRGILAAT